MNVILLPKRAITNKNSAITDPHQLSHIRTVLKASVGDVLKIGALDGYLGTGQITHMDDDGCVLAHVVLDTPPPPKLDLTVILALPRPKVLRRLMMDMTAFGVAHIVLINSARTDKSYWGSPLMARIDEFVLEGLQQGVDTTAPTITLAKRFKPFVQDELAPLIQNRPNHALVFHPYAKENFGEFIAKHPLPNIVIIGAEGGFVPYEIELLESVGVQAVTLGTRILRTESAVNAVLGRWC